MIEVCLILIGALALVGALCYLHKRIAGEKPADEPTTADQYMAQPPENPDECCGLHAVCEKTALNAATETIVYYDDDELDAYSGRPEDAYTEAEIEQFRDIMLTLQPHDVSGWLLSLNQRQIKLPNTLQPELMMLLGEA